MSAPRVGIGYDSHRFGAGRPLILGGVLIPHDRGLTGHSDADVLTHAVIDALLGAAGLTDVGALFPDTEAAYAGADSIGLLGEVAGRLGAPVGNVDATVVLERPRLGPHREAMRARLAEALGVPAGRVNVKATTNEGMGFVGREEGVAALAVAVLAGE
ncbi:MAG TPA: 2-C-methyl-D-erythritol 2,4-cyclodiphosphate synthase [Solirubrobacteraceae bacterium]|nr:2-C-methyl-D-erythritol 2,4-cyclodiphosphate synthase [Solirubrobacteraceae bacterium]